MKEEFLKWCLITTGTAVLVAIIVAVTLMLPQSMGVGDPHMLLRYLLLRLTALGVAGPALVGLMLFVDYVTPDDWMRAIGNDPKACSLVMSAVALAIAAVLCWT